jgi:trans-4-hydroxy-L-proline dehydratase
MPEHPPDLTALAVDLIAQGLPNPAFFGDETIQRGLQMYGVPPEESWNYVNSTCVEITPVGASNVWVASPYFSTCQFLLDEIAAQVQADRPAETFEDFLAGYRARLAREIGAAVGREPQPPGAAAGGRQAAAKRLYPRLHHARARYRRRRGAL